MMNTSGGFYFDIIPNCDCGSSCGCRKCNPQMFGTIMIINGETKVVSEEITKEDEINFYKKAHETNL